MFGPKFAYTIPIPTFIVLFACADNAVSPVAVPPMQEAPTSALAPQAMSSAPGGIPFVEMLGFVNPCTGMPETVTITGMLWIHERQGHFVLRSQSTVTTSSGFQGRRTRNVIDTGKIFKVALNAMLTNDSGDRIRIRFIQVVDVTTSTIHVMQGGPSGCFG